MRSDIEAEIEYLRRHGAVVDYHAHFLAPDDAERCGAALTAELEFNSPESSRVRVHGRWHEIPRRQSGYGDAGTHYTFAGCSVAARAWSPELLHLRERIDDRIGFRANFVLVNWYRSGADHLGWHADDERDIEAPPVIVSLTLGAARDFQLRRRDRATSGTRTVTLPLQHGSLLVLHDPTNTQWQHQVPRRGGAEPQRIASRLNLTFRRLVMQRA